MDTSPKHEAEVCVECFIDYTSHRPVQLANVLLTELLKEFQYMIHPVNHPVTRHVRRVVTSILEANELNTLSSG